jgi:hypothetical protein
MDFSGIYKPSFAIAFLFLGLCLVYFTQCEVVQKKVGNGIIKTKVIPTKEFNKIIVAGSIEMVITHGDSIKVTCEADSNLIKEVQVFREGNALNCGINMGTYQFTKCLITIEIPNLRAIDQSGSGTLRYDGVVPSDSLDFVKSGSGTSELIIEHKYLKIEQSGSGDISLKGNVQDFSLDKSGSGSLDGPAVDIHNFQVKMIGSGDSKVGNIHEMTITKSGSGEFFYKNCEKLNNLSKEESGSIKKS